MHQQCIDIVFLVHSHNAIACCLCRISNDPAINSSELRSKLDENREIGITRLNEVLDSVHYLYYEVK